MHTPTGLELHINQSAFITVLLFTSITYVSLIFDIEFLNSGCVMVDINIYTFIFIKCFGADQACFQTNNYIFRILTLNVHIKYQSS